MSILKDRTCPKCGEPNALTICATVGAVNCSCCFEFIRLLTKEEKKQLEKNIKRVVRKAKEMGLHELGQIGATHEKSGK